MTTKQVSDHVVGIADRVDKAQAPAVAETFARVERPLALVDPTFTSSVPGSNGL